MTTPQRTNLDPQAARIDLEQVTETLLPRIQEIMEADPSMSDVDAHAAVLREVYGNDHDGLLKFAALTYEASLTDEELREINETVARADARRAAG